MVKRNNDRCNSRFTYAVQGTWNVRVQAHAGDVVGADLRAALRERLRLASRVFTSFGRDHGFQGRAGTRFFMGGMASVPSHFSPCFLLLLRHRNDQPDGTEGTKSRKAFLQILVGEPGRTEDRGLGRPRHDVKRAGRRLDRRRRTPITKQES